jgi:uncharacterized protein (TIGR02611 family)
MSRRLTDRLDERRARHGERGKAYRVLFGLAGFVMLGAGLAMLVLPGPGLLAVAIGLAMLALEFAWAERLLERAVRRLEQVEARTGRRGLVAAAAVALAGGVILAALVDVPLLPI